MGFAALISICESVSSEHDESKIQADKDKIQGHTIFMKY